MLKPLGFSIIIPYRRWDPHVQECVAACQRLICPDFSYEIILLPDEITRENNLRNEDLRIQATGPVYPAEKRNRGVRLSGAPFCAFIDSDAYPHPHWLANAWQLLARHESVGCLGGPNHIPPGSPLLQRIGTRIIFCRLGVGAFPSRPLDGSLLEVKEIASSNLIVRRQWFEELGGFNVALLTAEDASLCFLMKRAGHLVVFAHDVEVFHHRRGFPWPYLRSIYRYGRDKAWLVKNMFAWDKYYYFIPALFVLGLLLGGIGAYGVPLLRWPYGLTLAAYGAAVFIQAAFFKSLPEMLLGLIGIPATHMTYGIGFLAGLITKNKKACP